VDEWEVEDLVDEWEVENLVDEWEAAWVLALASA
jgi:hypothetical protein